MSYQQRIASSQWEKIYVHNEDQCRRFVEGVFWVARSGAQWRISRRTPMA